MQNLGIKNIVLSSIFKADRDDTIDFLQVNASLGNENTTKELVKKLKAKGMLNNQNSLKFMNKIDCSIMYLTRYESDVEISSKSFINIKLVL